MIELTNWQNLNALELELNRAYVFDTKQLNSIEIKSLLSQTEQTRVAKYLDVSIAKQSQINHGLKRILLSKLLNIQPGLIDICVDDFGKPHTSGIHFNISHTGHYFAFIASNSPCGIDIETIKEKRNLAALIKRVVHSNELPVENWQEFYQIWCKKEAVSKAIGLGMRIGFKDLDTSKATSQYQGETYKVTTQQINGELMMAAAIKCHHPHESLV